MPADLTIFHHDVLWIIGIVGVSFLLWLLWNGRRTVATLRRSEKTLRESEAHLAAILAASPISTMLMNEQGVIIVANPAFGQRLGYDSAILIGQCVYDLLPPEVAAQRKIYVAQALRTGQPVYFEDQRGEYWLSHSLQPIRDATGEVRRIAVFGADITERHCIEQSLQRQTDLLAAIRQAQSLFILHDETLRVFRELLNILVSVTDSEYGFLDEILYKPDGTPYKVSLALSDIAWDEDSRHLYQQLVACRREFRNLNNLAGAPVLERRVVIANDVPRDPRYQGLSKGYPPLDSYLGIPLFLGKELIGVAGIANRPGGYTPELVAFLEPLTTTCTQLIQGMRAQRRVQEATEALARSEEQYRRIVETAAEGIWVMDRQYRITFANRRMVDLLGYAQEEMLGQQVEIFLFAEDLDDHRAEMARRMRGESAVYERRLRCKDGGVLWAIVSATALQGEDGQFAGSFAMFTDVSERKQMENALQMSHEYINAVLDSVNDAVFVDDARTGRIIDVNCRMCEMYGYRREEVLQLEVSQLSLGKEPYSQAAAAERMRKAREEGPQTFEWIAKKKSGHLFWVEVNIRFIVLGGEERFIVTVHDITDRKQMEEELRRLSTLDSLTGLLNRRQFFALAQQEYERFRRYHRPLALIMADIDYFKMINDQHGHLIGDQVLQAVAETLQRNLRQVDILGRYGGEEFVMVLPETDTATAHASAERLRAAIARMVIPTAQGSVSVTLSLGVAAISDGHPLGLEQLLDSADQMLYQAKQAGRNCVVVWDVTADSIN